MNLTFHVIPRKDLGPHNNDSCICPCNPIIVDVVHDDVETGGKLVVHNAYDHRDIFEMYRKEVSNKT